MGRLLCKQISYYGAEAHCSLHGSHTKMMRTREYRNTSSNMQTAGHKV